jgi:hypothetical protein
MRCTVPLLLLMLAGCQYDPHAELYTTVKPGMADVVGTYTLRDQTVAPGGLGALGGKPCSVELRDDGTFLAYNVPPMGIDGASPAFLAQLVNASGTWQIDSLGSLGDGRGSVKTTWGVRLDARSTPLASPFFTGPKPPHGLIFTIGDPDGGDALILEKTR